MSLIKNITQTIFGKTPEAKTDLSTQVEPITKEPNYKSRTLLDVHKQVANINEEVDPFQFPTKKKKKLLQFKKTKSHQVRLHLLNNGSINSWTAIELYGATRLSAIIFNLRGRGMNIESIPCSALDRNSNVCNYTTYKLNQ